ncbi:MAG: outer membrane protein [Janthinobacterium lividum]
MRKFSLRVVLCGFVATVISVPVCAQSAAYITGTAGYSFPNDITTDAGIRGKLKDGYALTLAGGTSIGPIRAEIEGSYRENKVGGASGFGLTLPGTGRASALSAMANAYFDPAFSLGPLKPYVGGGIGVSRFRASNISAVGIPFLGPVTGFGPINGSRTGFAYQAMAGVGIALAPHTALTVGYRYFATPGVSTDAGQFGRVHIDGLKIHAIEAGIRFAI